MMAYNSQNRTRKAITCCAIAASIAMAALFGAATFATSAYAADSGTDVAQVTAKDGSVTTYPSLKDAVAAAPEGATITMLADEDLAKYAASGTQISLEITKPLTLDGAGHTLTVHGRGIYITGSNDENAPSAITMRNVTVNNADPAGRAVSARNGYKTLAFEDVVMSTTGAGNTQVFTVGGNTPQTTKITFAGCTINASQAGYGIITFNPVDLTIADTDISGYAALYFKGPDSSAGSDGSIVNIVEGSEISSTGIAGDDCSFGTIAFQSCDDITVNVTNSDVTAQAATGEPATMQSVVMFSTNQSSSGNIANNDTVNFGEGSNVKALGENSMLVQGNQNSNKVAITDGDYQIEGGVLDNSANPTGTELVVTGGSWNKDISEYVPEGTAEVHDDDGHYLVGDAAKATDDDSKDDDSTGTSTHVGDDNNSSTADHAAHNSTSTTDNSNSATNTSSRASNVQPSTNTHAGSLLDTGDASWGIIAISAFAITLSAALLIARRRLS